MGGTAGEGRSASESEKHVISPRLAPDILRASEPQYTFQRVGKLPPQGSYTGMPAGGSTARRSDAIEPLPPPPRSEEPAPSFVLPPPEGPPSGPPQALDEVQPLPPPVKSSAEDIAHFAPLPPPPLSNEEMSANVEGTASPLRKRTRRGIDRKRASKIARETADDGVITIDIDEGPSDAVAVTTSSELRTRCAKVLPPPPSEEATRFAMSTADQKKGSGYLSLARGDGVPSTANRPVTVTPALNALLNRRRLPLVLDLDHTLLNSATFSDCEADDVGSLLAEKVRQESTRHPEEKSLHRIDRQRMWTKLRPGVRQFMRRAASLFEIHICTMGSQSYAEYMTNLLDPTRELVKGSVISLASYDEFGMVVPGAIKRLEKKLAGTEPAALILDDTAEVWPGHAENLIQCDRYVYFPACCRKFGMSGPSLLQQRRDECPDRGMLATAMTVLQRVHSEFFARRAAHLALATKRAREAEADAMSRSLEIALGEDSDSDEAAGGERPNAARALARCDATKVAGWTMNRARDDASSLETLPITVPELLAEEKRRVLKGVVLVFSCVIPPGMPPHEHALWRTAEEFGAKCAADHGPGTTHVVVAPENLDGPGGTTKMIWAAEHGRHIVTPHWLRCSVAMFHKANEKDFALPRWDR